MTLHPTVTLSSLVPPAALPPHTYCPPYLHRVGFSLAFGVATWAFSAGDARNGAGIATGMSLCKSGVRELTCRVPIYIFIPLSPI